VPRPRQPLLRQVHPHAEVDRRADVDLDPEHHRDRDPILDLVVPGIDREGPRGALDDDAALELLDLLGRQAGRRGEPVDVVGLAP